MTHRILFSFSLAIALLSSPGAVVAQDTPDEQARVDWSEARDALAARVEAAPDDVDLWYRLAVAQALAGDAASAADAFRRVKALAPEFPEIDRRIAAAEEKAAQDARESLDPDADAARARATAQEEDRWLSALRYELLLAPGADPAGDAHALAAEGDVDGAAQASVGALGESASGPSGYLRSARAAYLAGDGASARYFLDVFEVLGGDAAEASDLYDALEQSR